MANVKSIQVGKSRTYMKERSSGQAQAWESGFDKRPVVGEIEITADGMRGDVQADRKNHGGVEKAVLFYAYNHYADWNTAYPHRAFEPGAFGENITMTGLDESTVCIGDVYRIGTVVFEISQPRVPCWKISERWQEPTLTEQVRETGRTGWYARILQPGLITVASDVVRTDRSYPNVSIERLNALLSKKQTWTEDIVRELSECQALSGEWKHHIPNGQTS